MRMSIPMLMIALALSWSARGYAKEVSLVDVIRAAREAADLGELQDAERYLQEAIESDVFDNARSSEKSFALTSLGQVLIAMDRYGEAEIFLQRSLQIQRTSPTADPEVLAGALSNLALVYQAAGRYGIAESALERAMQLVEDQRGVEHPLLISILNTLGALCLETGEKKKAERFLNEALSLSEKRFGFQHVGLIPILNNLGQAFLQRKKWDRAETVLDRAREIMSASITGNHRWIGLTWNNLGYLYLGRKDFAAAEAAFRNAITSWQDVFGVSNIRVAVVSASLAGVLTEQGKYDEAETLLVRAIELLDKTSRPLAATFARTLEQYAKLLRLRSDERARALEDRAKTIRSFLEETVPAGA